MEGRQEECKVGRKEERKSETGRYSGGRKEGMQEYRKRGREEERKTGRQEGGTQVLEMEGKKGGTQGLERQAVVGSAYRSFKREPQF